MHITKNPPPQKKKQQQQQQQNKKKTKNKTKNKKNEKRGRIFILFKCFLNNLLLTVSVQNMISTFVKVLSQKLNDSL